MGVSDVQYQYADNWRYPLQSIFNRNSCGGVCITWTHTYGLQVYLKNIWINSIPQQAALPRLQLWPRATSAGSSSGLCLLQTSTATPWALHCCTWRSALFWYPWATGGQPAPLWAAPLWATSQAAESFLFTPEAPPTLLLLWPEWLHFPHSSQLIWIFFF